MANFFPENIEISWTQTTGRYAINYGLPPVSNSSYLCRNMFLYQRVKMSYINDNKL